MEVAASLRPAEVLPRREVVTAHCVEIPTVPAAEIVRRDPPALPVPPRTSQLVQPVEPAPPAQPPLRAPARVQRDSAEPLTVELSRLHVTVSRRFLAKLERARAALSHVRAGASAEEILEAGLDLVLEQQAKRKGVVENPRKVDPPAKTDHLPAHVKRAVWTRDDGRCQWPLDAGGVCGSTLRVEFDHAVPRARGGPPTIENVRLLCRVHNDFAARRAFGEEWMDRFTRNRTREGAVGPPTSTAEA
jgi:hypothetical protein